MAVLEAWSRNSKALARWREATSSGAGTLPESVPPQKGDSRDSQPSPPAPDDIGPPAPGDYQQCRDLLTEPTPEIPETLAGVPVDDLYGSVREWDAERGVWRLVLEKK